MAKSQYATVLNNKRTPITKVIPGRESVMAPNNGGGVGFVITPWAMLERFLILGSDAPTYYVSAQKMTKDNAKNIQACLKLDGRKTVDMIVDVSVKGRAISNDPALFALAVAASYGDDKTRSYALNNLNKVARIGTHLFHFAEYANSMRGWGRALKTAVANWYLDRKTGSLAHQAVKYQQRDGWSHRDLLRLTHAKSRNVGQGAVLQYIVKGELPEDATDNGLRIIEGFELAKRETNAKSMARLIQHYGLTHEMVPTQLKSEAVVWEALLENMPLGAMVRNLGNMSKVGLLTNLSAASKKVVTALSDQESIRQSRLHPLAVLMAQRTYAGGHGFRGSGTWKAVGAVVAALEEAFYMAFENVPILGQNLYFGIDVSSSMTSPIMGKNISSCEAAAAMAMVGARREKNTAIYGFSSQMVDLGITAKDTLAEASRKAQMRNWGSTNASAAIHHARTEKMFVDGFIVITDNDINTGGHPSQVLKEYRGQFNPNAKLVVMATTASRCSIADPADAGMLDVVGFDASVPTVITNFLGGGVIQDEEEVD